VRGLVRAPESGAERGLDPALRLYRGELPDAIDPAAFAGVEVVVHCAWAARPRSRREADRVNRQGSLAVRRLARGGGARFVFVSSLAARPGTASRYGRDKLAVEAALDPATDLTLRPGLVLAPLDPEAGGLFFRLASSLRRFRVAPLVAGGRGVVQPVHVDDLAGALDAALAGGAAGVVTVADPCGIEVRELFRALAEGLGVRHLAVPVPLRPTLAVVRALERLRLPLPLSSDNLIGQSELERVDCGADLARLGVRVRRAAEALAAALAAR